jgi:hypothetical protein
MRTQNSNLASPMTELPVMTLVRQSPQRQYKRKMVRFVVKDMNNRPLSFASVNLKSEDGTTALKYDKKTDSFIARRFTSGIYELEIIAESFVTKNREIYIPKNGLEKTILLAK